jgi:hypothetical protein
MIADIMEIGNFGLGENVRVKSPGPVEYMRDKYTLYIAVRRIIRFKTKGRIFKKIALFPIQ